VFADEIQFMEAPHFDGSFHLLVHALLQDGHAVTCAGLDLDWRGLPFDVTARLLAMADHVEKLKARCNASGQPASKTFRKSAEGPRIVLGAGDVYEARANRHWSLEPAERERARRAAGA
jgi:thymidine kinase